MANKKEENKEEKKGGFFSKKEEEEKKVNTQPSAEIYAQVNEAIRRIRIIEGTSSQLRKKIQLNDQNRLNSTKEINTEILTINEDVKEIKKSLIEINEKIAQIGKELQLFAKKNDVKVIQKYMKFWEPLKFVTHDEIETIVKEIMQQSKK